MEARQRARVGKRRSPADAGYSECWLRQSAIAHLVQEALLSFDGVRYRLLAWCILPNHLHALIESWERWPLAGVIHAWKSFTAQQINKLVQRSGAVRQREYHNRFIRDAAHHAAAVACFHDNPMQARQVRHTKDWPWSSAHPGKAENSGTADLQSALFRNRQGHAPRKRSATPRSQG